MQHKNMSVLLGERTRRAVLASVGRYDPDFATALSKRSGVLSMPECVMVWNAVIDEVDIALAGAEEAQSSPFFDGQAFLDQAFLDQVLDEMAEFKRAAVGGNGVALLSC